MAIAPNLVFRKYLPKTTLPQRKALGPDAFGGLKTGFGPLTSLLDANYGLSAQFIPHRDPLRLGTRLAKN